MPRKLSQEEFCKRVYEAVGNRYNVISEYNGKTKPVIFHCNIHNINFKATAECFMRGSGDVRSKCPLCAEEDKEERFYEKNTLVECAYCGKQFYKKNSRLETKSGLHFCCREHKDLAQRLSSGQQFNNLRPEHYGKEDIKEYRLNAFRNYIHECSICHWNEDEDILEVHHIDENRNNNNLNNLIILCPICHRKLTSHKYKLINRTQIIKLN